MPSNSGLRIWVRRRIFRFHPLWAFMIRCILKTGRMVFDFYEKVLAGEEKDFRSEMRILKPGATNEWNWVRMNVVVTKFEPEAWGGGDYRH